MGFSERFGYKKTRVEIQNKDIDIALRNGLWSCLKLGILDRLENYNYYAKDQKPYQFKENLANGLWLNFFKLPIDTRPFRLEDLVKKLRSWFFGCEWNEVYDLIEFVISVHGNSEQIDIFVEKANNILKRELSGYRIVSSVVTPITSESDLTEIKKASENPIQEIREHLGRALELLSDRKNPDYRNSIKESISAVETLCRKITRNDKATLGDALNRIQKSGKVKFHRALQSAYSSLYGYTNDADGIRHSLMEETDLDIEDALFMLTSCSAFTNYLVEKVLKSGLKL